MKYGDKELFSVIGKVALVEGKKRFIPNSTGHFNVSLARLFVGKKLTASFSAAGAIRSNTQLRYHWVLMGYLSDHTGYTKEELHDWVMRVKFGEKAITIQGITMKTRKSLSDTGKMPKHEAVELIDFDKKLCADLDIHIPTAEELGYLPS